MPDTKKPKKSQCFHSFSIFFTLLFMLSLSSLTTGCGEGKSMVKEIEFKTYELNNDLYGELKTSLATGRIMFIAVSIPLVDPKNPLRTYGSLSILNSLTPGVTILDLTLNLTAILKEKPLDGSLLPNGMPVPIGVMGDTVMVAIPVGKTGARIYLGVGKDTGLVGFALTFKEFNVIGTYVPGLGIFIPFTIGEANGVAGFFTGQNSGSSGIGLFADISKYVHPKLTSMEFGSLSASALRAAPDMNGEPIVNPLEPGRVEFTPQGASPYQQYRLYKALRKLERKEIPLNLE